MSGGTHLRLGEREQLATLKAEGLSLRAIAARLGRAASTISRELRRNALPRGGYLPVQAEGCYRERRQRRGAQVREDERRNALGGQHARGVLGELGGARSVVGQRGSNFVVLTARACSG